MRVLLYARRASLGLDATRTAATLILKTCHARRVSPAFAQPSSASNGCAGICHITHFTRMEEAVNLTNREMEVLSWIASGKSDWQIGQILKISQKTVNYHVENVKRKYGVATRVQAVVEAMRQGTLEH